MSAARQTALESDSQARLAAQTQFDRPLLLVAGAGTGKTTALVARVVAWCVGEGWQRATDGSSEAGARSADRIAPEVLSRVVAITFTEAAAAEMALRVGAMLSQLAAGEPPIGLQPAALAADDSQCADRARLLLGSLDHLRVSTIHSFCRSLLSQHPLEANLHPRFEIDADERLHAEVVHEVVLQALREADVAPEASPLLDLARQGVSLTAVEAALMKLLGAGVAAEQIAIDPLPPERVERALHELHDAALQLWSCVEGLVDDGLRGNTVLLLEALSYSRAEIDAKRASVGAVELEEFLGEFCAAWEGKPRDRLLDWAKGNFNKGETERLGEATGEVSRLASVLRVHVDGALALNPSLLQAARALLTPLLARCREHLRARGVVAYSGLLLGARELLAKHAGVCSLVRAGIDQLLVDEFQDTDPVQCEIVRRLALDGAADSRPGLFLVGDPKQSIYGWRSADLRAYDGFAQELEAAGGETRHLCVNFRSAPCILDEVERVIEPIMLREAGVQPAFEALTACDAHAADTGFAAGEFAPVEHWVSWQWDAEQRAVADKTRSGDATALEAQALAGNIRRLHDQQGVAWGDVAVLFRAQTDLDEYLAALRELGVPYAVERDRSYYRRREIIDAAALVRCVLDPHDALAFVTYLRSPAVGVPDAALIPLWAGELPKQVAELSAATAAALAPLRDLLCATAARLASQRDELPGIERVAGWEWSALAGLETLAALRESFEHDPVDVFVERMRDLGLGEVTEGSRHLGSFRAANLERFHRELLAELSSGEGTERLLRRLRSDVAGVREAEEEGPKTAELDAVRVMTIHKAKGLDFEHVYVMQLHKASGRTGRIEDEVCLSGDALEYRLFGTATLGFAALRERSAQVAAVERVRALYVAMTRAKQRIVLCGKWGTSQAELAPEDAAAPVDLLRSRRALTSDAWQANPTPALEAWMSELAAAGASWWRDELAVRFCFPALAPRATGAGRARRAAVGLPSEPELQRQSQLLRLRRAQAREHMTRPWQRAASAASAGEGEQVEARASFEPDAAPEQSAPPDFGPGAEAAAAAGTAVHRVFEELDLSLDLGVALKAARERLPAQLANQCGESLRDEAAARALATLDRFESGPLFDRFAALRAQIVARELPVWLPPSQRADAPVGAVSGVIDLVYRDAATGELVVADYKTDRVEGDALAERAAHYAGQATAYVDALRDALQLDARPRFELWFLHAGEVIALELELEP